MSIKTAMLSVLLGAPLLGCSGSGQSTGQGERIERGLQFRWAETAPGVGLFEKTVQGTQEKLYLHKEVLLTGSDVQSAFAFPAAEGPAIGLKFTAQGKEKIARLTAKCDGRRLAIVVDGVVITAPKIVEPIPEHATIFGYFSMAEAEHLAIAIRPPETPDQRMP